jgi:DNA (cytosine-5)-methyltransferase 1
MIDITYRGKKNQPTAIDLFCGAGGMSLGFMMAGGTPIGAVDHDIDSIATYKKIFPKTENVHLGKIEDWKPKNKIKKPNVIIGGPPCQGFSLARGFRFVDDPRNSLYKNFIQAVRIYSPEFFVMENVQGITNIGNGIILEQILNDFHILGYVVEYKIVNMAEYGVPQLRKRAIFVGNRIGLKFQWPVPTHHREVTLSDCNTTIPKFVSVNEAIGNLMLPIGNYFAHRANSQMRGPRNRDAHTQPAFTLRVRGDEFALCEEPAESSFIPGPTPNETFYYREPTNEIQEYFNHTPPSWINSHPQKKIGKLKQVKLKGTRKITTREQARLQSFPDWITFEGNRYSQSRQIGNAVPPLFAYHLFKKVFSYL